MGTRMFVDSWRTVVAIIALVALIQGCASAPPRMNPLPAELSEQAEIPGMPNVKLWADRAPEHVEEWLKAPEELLRTRLGGIMDREHNYLAISGGGSNGAFGAGLLNGWTESGTRPEFTLVTGISTGGLIAPFAFLGPEYDQKLKEIYTSFSTSDLIIERSYVNIIRNDAISDTAPLRALIAKYVDEEMMQAIAEERRKGRILMIGTTNLDAARPVMWNIGEIARSGEPDALDLIHDIMLASASIPGAFPPVRIEVEANGKRYEEFHVDGGVTSQVFLYPLGLDWRKVEQRLNVQGKPRLFVIRNAYLEPDWETVDTRLPPILNRTISSLIRTQGIGDLFRLYLGSLRDGIDFQLASIPDDFDKVPAEPFDREYMNALFERGRSMSKNGYPWVDDPYGLESASTDWRPDEE
ncbi:MAG: patatin-like phospholipase family protein [Betaproteobacteria bacterium]|nr:MAG: patatin-like phospholipase family protein [Betaproteobacteria bacterium]